MILRFENEGFSGLLPDAKIDRENNRIDGVVAMHVGEALGHGVSADLQTLQIMADLGNSKRNGVKGRFGHPGISENATGKQVQLATNFRVKGAKLLHTSNFLESAKVSPSFSQDPIEYIFSMAETSPKEFGESAVLNTDLVWVLSDGSERDLTEEEYHRVGYGLDSPDDAVNELPVMRPVLFHYIDLVNEGALTHDGMFSISGYDLDTTLSIFQPGKSSYYAKEVFQFLDNYRRAYNLTVQQLGQILPDKVTQLLTAYDKYRPNFKEKVLMPKKEITTVETFETEEIEALESADEAMGQNLQETNAILAEVTESMAEESEHDAILSAIAGLQEDMANMRQEYAASFQDLRDYVTEVSKSLVGQARLLQMLDSRIKAMQGEKVLSGRVSRSPKSPIEALSGMSAFSFEAGIKPGPDEIADIALGETPTKTADMRAHDLSLMGMKSRQEKY